MSTEPKVYQHPRLILCEGPEDVCFFRALIEDRNIQHCHLDHTGLSRNDRGGNSKFGSKLRALKFNRTFRVIERILLVADSDDDPVAAFANVRAQVEAAGLPAPAAVGVSTESNPSIRIITMPHSAAGHLETCLIDAASATNPTITAFAQNFVDNVTTSAEWTGPRRDKLMLRSLVSAGWPRDPGINLAPLFQDIQARRRIPLNHQSFNPLAAILSDF